jgi:hypothetical protein
MRQSKEVMRRIDKITKARESLVLPIGAAGSGDHFPRCKDTVPSSPRRNSVVIPIRVFEARDLSSICVCSKRDSSLRSQ